MTADKEFHEAGRQGESLRRAAPESADDQKLSTGGLLAHVLEQTMLESSSGTGDALACAGALAIGRKYAGSRLVLDPILIELVEAMLLDQFQRAFPREDWHAVAKEVAQRLFDDPGSQPRLHEFWRKLSLSSHEA